MWLLFPPVAPDISLLMISLGFLCMYHWAITKDGWESRWVKSEWKKDEDMAGEWNYTAGKWHGDPNDKGTLPNCIICVCV